MGTASATIPRLSDAGYLSWGGSDAEQASLHLTERGVQAARIDPLIRLAEALEDLPADQRESVRTGLNQVFRRDLGER